MELFLIFLFILAVIISLIPTTEDIKKNEKDNRCLSRHNWVRKEVPEVSGSYIVCSKCFYNPETEQEEIQFKE